MIRRLVAKHAVPLRRCFSTTILTATPDLEAQTISLSRQFGLDFYPASDLSWHEHKTRRSVEIADNPGVNFVLSAECDGLKLFPVGLEEMRGWKPLELQLGRGRVQHHIETSNKQDLLWKAVGQPQDYWDQNEASDDKQHDGPLPWLLDATAGLGRESSVFAAAMGWQVRMCEQNPALALMLSEALRDWERLAQEHRKMAAFPGSHDNRPNSIKLAHHGDACDCMDQLLAGPREARPAVIYLDLMFPERSKSSRVKKEQRYLQALAGDNDVEHHQRVVAKALETATHRVVLKRPKHTSRLGPVRPTRKLRDNRSDANRYDVWIIR